MTVNSEPSKPHDFQKIFRSVPGLYLVLEPDFTIVDASEGYLQATKTQREAIIGHGLFEIFPDNPDDDSPTGESNLRASLERVVRDHQPDTMAVQKYDIRRPESEGGGFEERFWSPVNSPVMDDDGATLRYIVHRVEDVTEFVLAKRIGSEQQRMADELRTKAGQMEAEIYRRAQQIHEANALLRDKNDELERLNEKAAELDRLKTHFFANVSHELRTPLTLILGPVSRLLESARNDDDRHDLQVIQRNASILVKQVTDLLDISKLEAGSMAARYSRFDLGQRCRLVASHFETLAHDAGIAFDVRTPVGALPIEADPEKVERILLNLLSNAFKATPRGGAITLTTSASEAVAMMTVADTGPGIPVEMRDAVFERFRQLRPEESVGGTGLGLSIVREFVSLHHGSARVETAPGGGAAFVIQLPRNAPEGVTVEVKEPLPVDESAGEALVTPLRARRRDDAATVPADAPLVLVVEDNPEMNTFIAETLGKHYRVLSAFDGRDGLEKALAYHPALIVTDIMMPVSTGEEMVAALRERPETRAIPVIMLTARADDSLRARMLRDTVQDYLPKPFQAEVLLARAGSLIDEQARHQLQMQQAYELLRASTDWLADIIFVKDTEGRYLMINPAGAEFLNTTVEEVVGKPDAAFLPSDVASRIREADLAVMNGSKTVTYEETIETPNGARIHLTTKGPFKSQSGEVIGLIGIARNITAQKDAERALAESESRQRGLLRDILRGVTEGKLRLCEGIDDLPAKADLIAPPVPLNAAALSALRRIVMAAAEANGFAMDRTDDLVTATSEAAMNAVVHAGGGTASVTVTPDRELCVWVEDKGSGIDLNQIPNATLEKGYTTAGTLGHGFFLILNTVDCIYLLTGSSGTTVVMQQHAVRPEPEWASRWM